MDSSEIHKMLRKIKNNLIFRYKVYKQREEDKILNRLKALHHQKIDFISQKKFTIISANCWGGRVYEDLNLPYATPTVGLFFHGPCFVEFIKDLRNNINQELTFVEVSKYVKANKNRSNNNEYPIGKLGSSIEIHFLHYSNSNEASEKWNTRKKRINWDNLYYVCTDRDEMTEELMRTFNTLKLKNKLMFTAKRYPNLKSTFQLKAFRKNSEVGNIYREPYLVTKDFDIVKWLNN